MTSPRDPAERPDTRGIGPGGGRSRRPAPAPARGPTNPALIAVALVSGLALVFAGAAMFVTLTRPAPVPAAEGSCRTVAWDALPTSDVLPEGWTITGSGFYTDGYGAAFTGPAASGTQTAPALNVRVSCYGTDGHLAVTRSHASDLALGGTDVPFSDLGDETLATRDASGTTTSVYIRRGALVASIAAQGISPDDLEYAASAIDDAMFEAEATAAESGPAEPNATDEGAVPPDENASNEPEPTEAEVHSFPDLEALLPKTVDGTPLSTQSTTSTDLLPDDPSDPLVRWLNDAGKTPVDLEIAEAYDLTSTVDAEFTAFRIKGIAAAELRQELLASWLGANESGVTTTNKTIGGKAVLAIDYGDGSALDYVFEQGDVVILLSSADPALVERILAGLK
ncbi:MAG: hypothetical protein ACXWWR_03165 [Candidatus Limnocylindrales bacterium]